MRSDRFVSSCPSHLCRFAGRALAATLLAVAFCAPAMAQSVAPSMCQAVAQALPGARFASVLPPLAPTHTPLRRVATAAEREVVITFVGHSTYRIETPGGVVIATDYSGYGGNGPVPTVVTMNHAHTSHFTNSPDPGIEQVLRGWNPDGGHAEHHLVVGDVLIRNVTTDIRTWDGGFEPEGNSIFIFEVADLCIGHLGHLHQVLEDDHIALIGRLDVVMVPVDGGYTMNRTNMINVIERLRSSVIIPMHWFSGYALTQFLDEIGTTFAVEQTGQPSLEVSLRDLPPQPTIMVLQPRYLSDATD